MLLNLLSRRFLVPSLVVVGLALVAPEKVEAKAPPGKKHYVKFHYQEDGGVLVSTRTEVFRERDRLFRLGYKELDVAYVGVSQGFRLYRLIYRKNPQWQATPWFPHTTPREMRDTAIFFNNLKKKNTVKVEHSIGNP